LAVGADRFETYDPKREMFRCEPRESPGGEREVVGKREMKG
jgi:hypothetical protein